MKKRNLIISLLTFGGLLLSSCMLAREKQEVVWSRWYDNGDGTHTRHNLNDISMIETEEHHFVLTSTIEEPTEVAPGKAIYTCEQCAHKETQVVPPTENYVFNQKVIDDKYLLERYSDHSACYYMSSIEGAFGDPRYVFETSDIPSGYTEVDYIKGDGRQWINTGVENDGSYQININNDLREDSFYENYVELDYVRSTGSQWIDAQLLFNPEDKVSQVVDLKILDETGCWSGANYFAQFMFHQNFVNTHERVTLRQEFSDGVLKTYVNDSLVSNVKFDTAIPENVKMGIFRMGEKNNTWTAATGPSSQILYKQKIYKNTEILRDFVPCYRKSDDAVGLFDLVSNSFFNNEGSSPLLKGVEINGEDTSRDYNVLEKADIPDYYYQLNYVESTGLQDLDTGITGGLKIEATLKFAAIGATQIMGYSDTDGHYFGVGTNNKYIKTEVSAGNIDNLIVDFSNETANKGSVQINEEVPVEFDVPDLADKTFKLFSVGTKANKSFVLIYSAKIYQGENLVRNFVPVMQKQTKAVGLYDLVEQRFYESSTTYSLENGGITFANLETENINAFCNTYSNKSHPIPIKISTYQILKDDEIIKDFVSAIRNSDGVLGLYDIKNKQFYVSDSEFQLTYGKIIGHKFDEGTLVRKATHNVGGEIVYKCIYVDEEIHLTTDCAAFKITFISDNGNLSSVKIFNNNDPSNFDMSMIGYSRNPNTYNYSKSGAFIHFEIPDDGNEYLVTTTSGKVVEVEEQPRQFKITGITSDSFVQLRLINS